MRWARGKHFPEGRPGRSSPLGAGGMKEWDSVAGLSGHSFPYPFTSTARGSGLIKPSRRLTAFYRPASPKNEGV